MTATFTTQIHTYRHIYTHCKRERDLIYDKQPDCLYSHAHIQMIYTVYENTDSAQQSVCYLFRASICLSRSLSLSLRSDNKRTEQPIPVNEPDAAVLGTERGPWGWEGERERQVFLSVSPHCHVPPSSESLLPLSAPRLSACTQTRRREREEREREEREREHRAKRDPTRLRTREEEGERERERERKGGV